MSYGVWIASYLLVFSVGMWFGVMTYKAGRQSAERYVKEHPGEFRTPMSGRKM